MSFPSSPVLMQPPPPQHPGPVNDAGRRAVGELSSFPFRVMRRILECLANPDDLLALTQTCWCLFVLANEESLWKAVCLQPPLVDPATKYGHWTFKGSWKHTVLHPQREVNGLRQEAGAEGTVSVIARRIAANASGHAQSGEWDGDLSLTKTSSSTTMTTATRRLSRANVRSAKDWNTAVTGKAYYPGVWSRLLSVSHGAVNYLAASGDFCQPPHYALQYGVLKGELPAYRLHNLIGENVLDVVPVLPPYTSAAFYATWNHKVAYVEACEAGSQTPYVPLTPASAAPLRSPSLPFIYDEQVGVPGVVDRRYQLSVEEFQRQYEATNTPVVLTGCIDHWPARRKWLCENFCTHYGEAWLKPNGRSTDGRRFRLTARDFFAYAQSTNGEKPMYVFDKKILVKEPRLLSDFEVPPYFREDFFATMDEEDRPDYRWLLIGPDGSGTPYHTDPHASSAWNAVLDGVKRFSFYHPEVIPPGVREELIHSDYYASQPYMEWYRKTLPGIVKRSQCQSQYSASASAGCSTHGLPLEALVFPGDLIFVPSGWWHQVINYGLTIAVTQNVCSRFTFPRVVQDMNRHAGRGVRQDFATALEKAGRVDLASAIDVAPPPRAKRQRSDEGEASSASDVSETNSSDSGSSSGSSTSSSEDGSDESDADTTSTGSI